MNGEETILVKINPYTYTEFLHPLKEYIDIPTSNVLPFGWSIGFPAYYDFLSKYGVENGKEFIDYSINNDNVIYSYYESAGELTEVQKIFEEYLNNRHAIPNKKITLDVYLDDRIPNSGYGIVYYKLIAK